MRSVVSASIAIPTLLSLLVLLIPFHGAAETFLIKDREPLSQIVIAEQPPRAVPVAASELQTFLERISGAKLPIATAPNPAIPSCIYVGESDNTRALGITTDDLKHGAYRMISGDHWLALVGHDSDYVFRGPHPESLADKDRTQAEWEQRTGTTWSIPYGTSPLRHYNPELNLWYLDEKGSINAVYAFLEDLGVRWYLPGTLGEIVPTHATIALPDVNRTVRPDFALRYPHSIATFHDTDEALWAMRMGWNPAPDLVGPYSAMGVAHGMTHITRGPEVRAEHPEYFALIAGKRFMPDKNPSFCLSSQGLIDENARFVRAVFDLYDPWMVSVQPADSTAKVCQCPLCAGKGTPERGSRGDASDYVWEYIDRVAREVYKTHPDKKIAGLAYANYQLPPTRIDQLSPNIIVGTPSGRTFTHNDAQAVAATRRIHQEWLDKLPAGSKQTYHYEYFMDARPGRRTQYLPVFVPRSVAQSLRNVKGDCIGEHIDLARYRDSLLDLATMHLNLYVTSKLWWDADQDLDALLEEYYTLYYGPAREEMKAVIEYAETHWPDMPREPEQIGTFFDLLATAKTKAPVDSVYARRIALIADYTAPMEALRTQKLKGHDESVPPVILRGPRPAITASDITIDGRLDEDVWQNYPGPSTLDHLDLPIWTLRDLITGETPRNKTTFRVFWADGALYFGIRCEDSDMAHLRVGSTANDDTAIWQGDLLELHLETQSHSYYALVVNPAGAVTDLDWEDNARNTLWNSGAKVAAYTGGNFWSVELRVPVVDEMEGDIVELGRQGVVGRQPTGTYPWYMNLVRQRLRDDANEYSAYSPTGKRGFHDPAKFARLSAAK